LISSAFLASFTRPFANPLRLTISGPPFVPRPRLSPHIIPNWNRGMRLSLTQSLTFILKTNSANEPRRRWVQLRFRLPMICSRELPLSSRSTRDSLSCLKSSVLMHVVMQCDFVSYLPPRVKQPALSFDYSSIAINTHLMTHRPSNPYHRFSPHHLPTLAPAPSQLHLPPPFHFDLCGFHTYIKGHIVANPLCGAACSLSRQVRYSMSSYDMPCPAPHDRIPGEFRQHSPFRSCGR